MNTFWKPPQHRELAGKFVTLSPFDPATHGAALYEASHGTPEKLAVWNYLFYGPFDSAAHLSRWYMENLARDPNTLLWTARIKGSGKPVGVTSLLNITPPHGRAEIGHVWFSPEVHRTAINTESQYLLLKHLFDDLNYRRAEWKCDSLNEPSRTTAARMGFLYEGRFRQHMVVREKNRDTDWFAMTDKDWPSRRENFERWLYSGEKVSLRDLNQA